MARRRRTTRSLISIGISTDATGRPIRLFTTNRWVTGEIWHDADSVIGMLERFDITVAAPARELNRWLSALLRLFRPQIVELVRRARRNDRALARGASASATCSRTVNCR